MSRVLYEAVPVTTELDVRLRRMESRIAQMEAAMRERATAAAPPVARIPAPVAQVPAPAPVARVPVEAPVAPPPDRRWAEIGSRLEALALKLKLHYEQAGGERAHALDEVGDRVRDAFTAAGNAIHDEAVRSDVRDVGAMVADALADAMTTVGEDMREALRRTETKGGTS
jgi:hypothetical protein